MADKSLLVEFLTNAGMVVKIGEEQNILKEDQAIFLKKFNKDIPTALDYLENIEHVLYPLQLAGGQNIPDQQVPNPHHDQHLLQNRQVLPAGQHLQAVAQNQ